MKYSLLLGILIFASVILSPAATIAQPSLEDRVRALEADQKKFARQEEVRDSTVSAEDSELTKLQLQLRLPQPLGRNYSGLPPGMSRIYSFRSPFNVGGFAEINYLAGNDGARSTTVARFNPYLAWRFSEGLIFNSGLSLVNGGITSGGNPADGASRVEFAYLDILTGNDSGIRVGHVIVPFGLVAYRFEPNLYPMVNRPQPESLIIPSTWHENGILGYGKVGSVLIQGGVVNAGDASQYLSENWIARGRQNGASAKAANPAIVLRSEVLTDKTSFGLSLYGGNSSQGNSALGDSRVLLGAIHGEILLDRFSAKALYTEGALSDTDKIFALTNRAVGSRARGGYAIFSYDVLSRIAPIARSLLGTQVAPGVRELPGFAAYEYTNTAAAPTEGRPTTNDFANERLTFGINYLPHPQVSLKADVVYESIGTGANNRLFELGVAAVF